MGKVSMMSYSGPPEVLEELEAARRIYREGGFHVVEVTDKPIEIIADEIIKFISHNLDHPHASPCRTDDGGRGGSPACQDLLLHLEDPHGDLQHGIRVEGDGVDPFPYEKGCKFRVVAPAPARRSRCGPVPTPPLDDPGDERHHSGVTLVEDVGHQGESGPPRE